MNNFFQSLLFKALLFFSGAGFLVAFSLAAISAQVWTDYIVRPLVVSFTLGILWVGAYFLLKIIMPDFIQEMEGIFQKGSMDSSSVSDDMGEDFNFDLEDVKEEHVMDQPEEMSGQEGAAGINEDIKIDEAEIAKNKEKANQVPNANEIMVDGVKIQKDPELMAKAVQHVLDQDEDK